MPRDIVVLGIHDSFIVEQQHEEVLREAMVKAFHHLDLSAVPVIIE